MTQARRQVADYRARGRQRVDVQVDRARFRKAVTPGDQLRIEVDVLNWRPLAARLEGKVYVEGKLACEATIMCAVVPRPGRLGADKPDGPTEPAPVDPALETVSHE